MTRTRWIALSLLALTLLGSLGLSLGYGCYLRSDGYRESCARTLSDALGLPSEIGRVIPRSRLSQEFRDIVVWLPQRRDRAHVVERAVLTYLPTTADPDAYEIEFTGGSSEVSTRTWLRADYRDVIESGLRPGFSPDGPRRVTFSGMNLAFERDRFRLQLTNAAGHVAFESRERGRAFAKCNEVNGFRTKDDVTLLAEFSPQDDGIRLDRAELRIPDVPIRVANLLDLVGVDVRTGRFDGLVVYQERDDGRHTSVAGHCFDIDLLECTTGLIEPPVRGRCAELELRELEIVNRRPTRLRFRGALSNVSLGDIMAIFGIPDVTSAIALNVGDAIVTDDGIVRMVASGTCADLSLESLSRGLGFGVITGTLHTTIQDLTIEDNRIQSLDAVLRVEDAEEDANWIETRLLREILARTIKLELPPLPMQRLEFSKLGMRVQVRGEKLQLFGTHGEGETTILTARILGRDIGLVGEPKDTFDLAPLLEPLRLKLAAALRERVTSQP